VTWRFQGRRNIFFLLWHCLKENNTLVNLFKESLSSVIRAICTLSALWSKSKTLTDLIIGKPPWFPSTENNITNQSLKKKVRSLVSICNIISWLTSLQVTK
jgi:hypothetical protein